MFDNQTDHLAERGALADIATILGISRASVQAMDDTVQSLGRIAGLRDAFTAANSITPRSAPSSRWSHWAPAVKPAP